MTRLSESHSVEVQVYGCRGSVSGTSGQRLCVPVCVRFTRMALCNAGEVVRAATPSAWPCM